MWYAGLTGADKWLKVQHHASTRECLDELTAEGYTIIASHIHDSAMPLQDLVPTLCGGGDDSSESTPSLSTPLAVVFGNEVRVCLVAQLWVPVANLLCNLMRRRVAQVNNSCVMHTTRSTCPWQAWHRASTFPSRVPSRWRSCKCCCLRCLG